MPESALFPLLAGLAGLLAGSFLNVCIYRLPQDLSVVHPRSFCPNCKAGIAWYDNIPLVSFFLLGRRCRRCGEPIRWRYPIVELLVAVIFAAAVAAQGLSVSALKASLFGALLVGMIFTDLEERILPDEMTVGGAVAGMILSWWVPLPPVLAYLLAPDHWGWRWRSLAESLLAAWISMGVLWLVGALYERIRQQEGLGLGDVKMMGMVGAFLGLEGAFLTLIVGSVTGTVAGLLYILLARKDPRSYLLPFGAFLGLGGLVVLFSSQLEIWLHAVAAP